jgi:hypothetical protein
MISTRLLSRWFFVKVYGLVHPTLESVGIFVGTSVNNFGNFTVGPTYDIYPGIQVLAGLTMRNKTTLQTGNIKCSGFGTSPSYSTLPASNGYDVTAVYTPTSATVTKAITTVTENKTSMSTSIVSGCTNGNLATITSGSTPPTQTQYAPAFSLGILFNSNLMKAFNIFK